MYIFPCDFIFIFYNNTSITSFYIVLLFIEILNQYLYYFQYGLKTDEAGPVPVEIKHLRGLRNLINDHLEVMESGDSRIAIEAFFKNTLQHIEVMKTDTTIGDLLKELDG